MKQKLTILAFLVLILKVLIAFAVNHDLIMNLDEQRNYEIAFNHQNGNGYSEYNPETKSYRLSAFYPSFPVYIYEFLIRNGIKKEIWVLGVYILSIIMFSISILYFYKLSLLFIENEKYAFYSTITYCFYPSIIYFVGALHDRYENLVLPLLVILMYKLIMAIKEGYKKSDYWFLPLTAATCCLLRPQTIAILGLISFVYLLIIGIKRSFSLIPLIISTIIFVTLCHIPILEKNKKMFGEYTMGTQSGFELLQGHNPTAKGSWRGGWIHDTTNSFYQYSHAQIKNLSQLNEMEECNARKKLAINWIKENPISEIKLSFRKVVIYFLPTNLEILYGYNFPNPINLLTHIFFICLIFWELYKKQFTLDELLILSPIVGTILISIIYFVGYRWRYFAEPFMIIFAWKFIAIALSKIRNNRFINTSQA